MILFNQRNVMRHLNLSDRNRYLSFVKDARVSLLGQRTADLNVLLLLINNILYNGVSYLV